MIVNKLKLTNFRNHLNYEIKFAPTTIITGSNGAGKTNILEALFILAITKSFRIRDERNLINYDKDFAQISAQTENDQNIDFFVFLRGTKVVKQVKINGLLKKMVNLVGKLKVVLFSPESLQIITGSPIFRRRFIDICLSQTDIVYAKNMIFLKKILSQRNELLKRIVQKKAKEKELDFWDDKLIKNASYIISRRRDFLKYFNLQINNHYQEIDKSKKFNIKIKYQSKVFDVRRYQEILVAAREQELARQKTIFSPHLDDFVIQSEGRLFREISSRGEIRSLLIALKMIELNYLEKDDTNDEKAMVLLDDVFSELDKERQEAVIKIIQGRQSVITTTDLQVLKKLDSNIKIIKL